MEEWPTERIAGLSLNDVRALRENAVRLHVPAVVERCDADLARRAPVRNRPPRVVRPGAVRPRVDHHNQFVSEYHYVCRHEEDVTRNDNGTIWTGTWVARQSLVEESIRFGAHVALHRAKAELSYLQGIIIDWRVSERPERYVEGQPINIQFGVDFLLQPTIEPFQWRGDGAYERGYRWQPMPPQAIAI